MNSDRQEGKGGVPYHPSARKPIHSNRVENLITKEIMGRYGLNKPKNQNEQDASDMSNPLSQGIDEVDNVMSCELWAKYCCPDKSWSNKDFQLKLHTEHRMLCHRHFNETAFVDFPSKKLKRFASPDVKEDITLLCNIREPVAGPSQPLVDISNRCSSSTVNLPGFSDIAVENKEFMKCKKYLRKICLLKKQLKYMKTKNCLQKLGSNDAVTKLSNKISPNFALLLQAQIRNFKKSAKGRRWTGEDKITALRLYKRSPTCYRLLRRMFCLPAPTTLKVLLSKCVLNVGINKQLFEIVGKFSSAQEAVDNEYILMFDEMALKKHLQYNVKEDSIEGFQDHGVQGRTPELVSYALVFMVAGIRKKIKQPMAYYLSGSTVTADRLAVLIKEVLEQCQEHGINIAASVCDMDGVNRRALSILGATTTCPYFKINNKKVVALFDPPHLIKCFRNLFLKYDIQCSTNITSADGNQGTGVAKWSHIVKFYELDSSNPNFVFAPLLRQEHLNPNTKQKMRVKLAVQVLSHTVACGLFVKIARGELPADAAVTADVITKMDKLFDTLNSDTVDLRRGKPFSTNLKISTPQLKFISEMKLFMQSLKFIGSKSSPPSQTGWLWTLNAVEMVWESLRQKHKSIKSLATRRLQQDPLENLFGCIRGNCGSNCSPTTGQFVAGLKTAILSNLAHIGGGNCELDSNEVIIDNFKMLFSNNNRPEIHTEETSTPSSVWRLNDDEIHQEVFEENGESQACAYVCGFLIKNYQNDCETCKTIFTTSDRTVMHCFIQFKEYNDFKESLNYASKNFVLCVEFCATYINGYLSTNAHKKALMHEVSNILKASVNFNFLSDCMEHKEFNINYIIKNIFHITIKRFCTKKNRSFSQESATIALKKKINLLKHV